MHEIEEVLESIEKNSGLKVSWKGVGKKACVCGFSEKHTLHCNKFCSRIKDNKTLLQKCIENDNILIPAKAESKMAPFIHTCHAGVSELVVPVFENGYCTEVILAGIFKAGKASNPYPGMEKLFTALPKRTASQIEPLKSLIGSLAGLMKEKRDVLNLSDVMEKTGDKRIVESAAYIRKNISGDISADRLAENAFLSTSRFIHLFKQETGMNLTDYINMLKMENAKGLLRETNLQLMEIMSACGFSSQSYFGMKFRKYSSMSPLAYRRKFRRETGV